MLNKGLVALRDAEGRFGLLAHNCPHRGASLFFGRNEESGPRCVYHGWKFDVDGTCVDMPNEPAESDFRTNIDTSHLGFLHFGAHDPEQTTADLRRAFVEHPELDPAISGGQA